ncbi:3200_t:CDS:2, partial [Cetraspora pellucida]
MEPNNEPNMKPNNEPDIEPDNKPDIKPGNEPNIEPNNKSNIEPMKSDIEPMETNLDCNDESSDESNGWSSNEDISLISPLNLHTGMTFSSWTIVNKLIKAFAYHNGFSVQKYHSEKSNRKCIRCIYLCRHSSIYKPVKDKSLEKQRNKSSAQIDCSWKIHIRFQKKSHNLRVSSFVDKHKSHPLTPGHLGATDQYRLLKASYPYHTLYKKDIYNAIQQFHNENDPNLNDAARLLEYLLDQKYNNNN